MEVGAEYKESLTMVKLPIIQDEIRLCWNPFQNMVKLTEIIYEWFANSTVQYSTVHSIYI